MMRRRDMAVVCWFLPLLVSLSVVGAVRVRNLETTQKWADQFNATLTRALQSGIVIPEWGTPDWAGSAGVDFAYQSANYGFDETGASGMSYYVRAFDMFPKHYTEQLGWGQWLSPAGIQDPGTSCPLNPHNLICYPSDLDGPNPENYPEVMDCTWPEGSANLNNCQDGECGWEERPIFGAFEGGMGYWPYTTGHSGVKFLTPSSVSGYYHKFGGHFVLGLKQPCTNLGGAIQVSNNLVFPADFFSFEEDDEGYTDGFLGYMLQRTPIGKLHKDDNRNYWTIVLDSANWAGPVVYSSAYFWEHPNSWQPDIKTFADPDVRIKYTAHGTEGGIATTVVQKDGWYWMRTQDVIMPLDSDDDAATIFSNHAQYHTDWMHEVLEPILDGTKLGGKAADIRAASTNAREKPECILREAEGDVFDRKRWTISQYDPDADPNDHPTGGFIVSGWGVGDHHKNIFDDPNEAEDNWCRTKIPIDKTNPNLVCDDKKCKLSPYFRLPVDRSTTIGEVIPEDQMPADVKAAVDARADSLWEEPSRVCDGTYLSPREDSLDSTCFNTPGPASDTVYCRRTTDERWIAYQWYRFVDQPELNQVFASLPKEEQMEAKCYMQSRIERLHQMQARETVSSWFDAPGELPTSKVKIDEGFIVEPPAGFEVGYVPVSIYSRVREMPPNCDVVEGSHSSEPDPLPFDYYFNREESDSDRYPDTCYPTDVSSGEYDRVGKLFLSARDGSGNKFPYRVPHRDEVEAALADKYNPGQCDSEVIPTPSPTASSGSGIGVVCFSGDMMVDVKEKGLIPMSRLAVGDRVLAADNRYDRVYAFGHRAEFEKAEYLQILPSLLELSADHMVVVSGKGFIPASMAEVGDRLHNGEIIENIRKVVRRGAYAPFTSSGTIVVNGVLASTYISFQESEALTFGSLKTPFSYQWIAHTFHVPHRIWCHWLGMEDKLLENGFSSLTEPSFHAATWFLEQHAFVMAAVFVPFLLALLIFTGIEAVLLHPILTIAAFITIAYHRKRNKQAA